MCVFKIDKYGTMAKVIFIYSQANLKKKVNRVNTLIDDNNQLQSYHIKMKTFNDNG